MTRQYCLDLLVGESTREAAGEGLRWVEVDRVRVMGKQQVVTLFTPLAQSVAEQTGIDEEMRIWQLALASYRLQHWDAARARLAELLALRGDSPLRALYVQLDDRIQRHLGTPPLPGWDGAHTFESK